MAFQLCYSSIATDEMDRNQLVNLLKGSRERNQDAQITGLLLYSGDRFLQVLEGPEEAVRATYARIQRDSRHHDLALLFEEDVAKREYPDWSMGFQALEGTEWLEFPNPDGSEKGLRPMAEAMGRAKSLLQDIRKRGLDPAKDV